jgi:hypothetical protein
MPTTNGWLKRRELVTKQITYSISWQIEYKCLYNWLHILQNLKSASHLHQYHKDIKMVCLVVLHTCPHIYAYEAFPPTG